ncbi:MAG TPA: DMT family transporter [Lichenihabitans sp.]|nr:DMT family transporter [Lichenihabitans sp.]
MRNQSATLIAFVAIATWAFLALLSTLAGPIPPFQLAAMTFLLGGLTGAATWTKRPAAIRSLRQPWPVWALGTAGLCIYHCLYFAAIQTAPPVEVSLIAYLWPLLIVLFAALLPGERLRLHHLIGAAMGFAGAVIIITKGGSVGLAGGIRLGHVLALACAFVWSGYSVLSRRFGQVPTDVVVGYCLITATVAFLLHLAFETTVWPQTPIQWSAIVVLGTIPLGAAFYAWDYGIKHGDIMVVGAVAYAAPPLSVIVLLVAGYGTFHWSVAAACLLITAGAVIAAKDMLFQRQSALVKTATASSSV